MVYVHYKHFTHIEHPGLRHPEVSLDWRFINCPKCQELYEREIRRLTEERKRWRRP
jgi:hypothetical protein